MGPVDARKHFFCCFNMFQPIRFNQQTPPQRYDDLFLDSIVFVCISFHYELVNNRQQNLRGRGNDPVFI